MSINTDEIEQFEYDEDEDNEDELEEISSPVVINEHPQEQIPTIDVDEDMSIALLTPEERESRRTANRPDVSWLRDAIVDNKFIPKKNDYLVVERRLILNDDNAWLDTKTYRLLKDPTIDGNVHMFDCIKKQHAQLNWIEGLKYGFVFKLPPPGRNPETLFESDGRRKRKRKFVNAVAKPQPIPTFDEQGNVVKRKRGRPKGSKNKPKE